MGNFIELRAYDLRYLLRGAVPRIGSVPLTIVAIDEESFQAIKAPLIMWNGHMGAVVDGLVEGGAQAIGIDYLFADTTLLDAAGQQDLARSLINAGAGRVPVIIAYQVRGSGVDDLPAALQLAVMAGEHPVGYVNLTTDPDDFVRRQRLKDNRLQKPSFAMAVAEAYAKKNDIQIKIPSNEILIDFRERESLPIVSFSRVLEAARNGDTEYLRKNFANRVVLIARYGVAAEEDLHATPYYYWPNNPTGTGRRTPGAVIHANTIGTLIAGTYILPPAPFRQSAITLLLIIAIALVCAFCRPVVALPAATLILFEFLCYAAILAFQKGDWIWIAAPVVGGVLSLSGSQTVNYGLERKEKHRIRNIFKRYLKDEVIQQILQRPEHLVLHGERKRVAILFADVKGFTSRSEGATAEEIVSLLNIYFKEIVDAVQTNRGMVNSLMGDGLMAIFGAPIDDPDAALHAVQGGIAMREALERVNAKLREMALDPIDIGVGIHYGEAIVGNMGSPDMMEYTAIGDVVNTASRIEGLTRRVDQPILITQDVYEALNGRAPCEFSGEFPLRGKAAPLKIYHVVTEKNRQLSEFVATMAKK